MGTEAQQVESKEQKPLEEGTNSRPLKPEEIKGRNSGLEDNLWCFQLFLRHNKPCLAFGLLISS